MLYKTLQKGFGAVLKYDPSLCVLAYCLDSLNTQNKILILKVINTMDANIQDFILINTSFPFQMMVTVLLAPGGHRKVMQAFDYFRAIKKERNRFQLLMASLTFEPVDSAYQVRQHKMTVLAT